MRDENNAESARAAAVESSTAAVTTSVTPAASDTGADAAAEPKPVSLPADSASTVPAVTQGDASSQPIKEVVADDDGTVSDTGLSAANPMQID